MKAAVPSMALRDWLLKKPDWLDHQTAVELTFAAKKFAASLLALYIAFWAGLDDSRWAPGIVAEGSCLLARLSQTLRNPSVWKLSRRAGEARAFSRHALATARGSAEPEEIEALSGVVVGAATLGSDLIRARMVLQGKSNAIPI